MDIAANSLVDSTTGDRFSLTGQPSGYMASIMLPANVGVRVTAPAPRGAASGSTRQVSYTAVAVAPATRSFTPAALGVAPPAAWAAGPMLTTIPAILYLFQDVLNPGKELCRLHVRWAISSAP